MSLLDNANDGADPAKSQDPQGQLPGTDGRPEHIPEQFWKDGKLDDVGLIQSFNDVSKAKDATLDDLRDQFKSEFEKAVAENRPETADAYELGDMPEGVVVNEEELASNPLLSFWREKAFAAGLGQEDFQAGVQAYVASLMEGQPDTQAEIAKLGDTAQDRINAVALWSKSTFKEDEMSAIEAMTSTAGGIKALERVMKMARGSKAPTDGGNPNTGGLTHDELKKMQQDPRYWDPNQRDKAFVAQIETGFKNLVRD